MIQYFVLTGLVDEMISPTLPKADVVGSPLYGLNLWMQGALAAESDSLEPTERGPVTRWMGYAFGQPRATKADALSLLPLQPGDPNPLFQVTDAIVREGGNIQLGSSDLELAQAGPITREEWKNPGYTTALVLTGGEVKGLPVYFQVPDLDGELPSTFPNRTYTVYSDPDDLESGVETTHTWNTWAANSPRPDLSPVTINDVNYVTSQNPYDAGWPLNGSIWALLGLTVLSASEFSQLTPSGEV